MTPVHVPILRGGEPYRSLDKAIVSDARSGETLAMVSQANAGLIRRDLRKVSTAQQRLRSISTERLLKICAEAGEQFLHGDLPVSDDGATQSPEDFVRMLSATSGLPHVICQRNMAKIHTVLTDMRNILCGLMRGLDFRVIDQGVGEQDDVLVSFTPATNALGVVLPSNSPGVNSIWLPAVALKIPVILKPGREEPWTPMRILQALMAAGYPRNAFGYYPTDHHGAESILTTCGKAILFGDDATIQRYAHKPHIELHGTGRSKIIIGPDLIDRWPDLCDVLVASIADNGGRSCINASCIIVPNHAGQIADAIAKRLAAIRPVPVDDDDAVVAAFTNPQFAEYVDSAIQSGLSTPGAVDVTGQYRQGPRKVSFDGMVYLLPTVVHCESFEHPLANTEFLFPFTSVLQMSMDEALQRISSPPATLVASLITEDADLISRFLTCPQIDRLNIGRIPTSCVEWDQPHEGNLFELLYRRRAIQRQTA